MKRPTRTLSDADRRLQRHDPLIVLDYVARYQTAHTGSSPSQRQIQRGLGLSAPSVIHYLLHRLERAGLLTITTRGRGLGADLAVTEAGQERLRRWRAERQPS